MLFRTFYFLFSSQIYRFALINSIIYINNLLIHSLFFAPQLIWSLKLFFWHSGPARIILHNLINIFVAFQSKILFFQKKKKKKVKLILPLKKPQEFVLSYKNLLRWFLTKVIKELIQRGQSFSISFSCKLQIRAKSFWWFLNIVYWFFSMRDIIIAIFWGRLAEYTNV